MADQPQDVPQATYDYGAGNVLLDLARRFSKEIGATRRTRTPIVAVHSSPRPITGISSHPENYAYYVPGYSPSSNGFIALNTDARPQSPKTDDELDAINTTLAHEQWHAYQASNPDRMLNLHNQMRANPDYRAIQQAITNGVHYRPQDAAAELPAYIVSDTLKPSGYVPNIADVLLRNTGKGGGAQGNIFPMVDYQASREAAPALVDRIKQALIQYLTPDELKMVRKPPIR